MVTPPKNIRLEQDQYIGLRIYFVTVCCHKRRRSFENPEAAGSAIQILKDTASHQCFEVHAYCFMPDHLHVISLGNSDSSDILQGVEDFKHATGYWLKQHYDPVRWEKSFHDRIIRARELGIMVR